MGLHRRSGRSWETLEEGVLREILEESGVRASAGCLAGVYSNIGSYTTGNGIHVPTKIIFDFICDYIDGELASSDETSEVIWGPKESVMEYIALPVLQLRFKISYILMDMCAIAHM